MEKVLLAIKPSPESEYIRRQGNGIYEFHQISCPDEFEHGEVVNYALLVIDGNFSEAHGIDFLQRITSLCHLPILYLSSPNAPELAAKAVNSGAFNFIVKSEGYAGILLFAIKDCLRRFFELENLQAVITQLKERICELEGRGSTQDKACASRPQEKNSILSDIVKLLRTGDLNLPGYPAISAKFREMSNAGAGIREITALLQKDPGVSSKLISIANSPVFRGVSPVQTLEHAINRIGSTETGNYVELITNRSLYLSHHPKFQKYLQKLWMHSLASAYAAQEIGRAIGLPGTAEIFTIGLFHDIGKLLLVQILTELEKRDSSKAEIPEANWIKFIQDNHAKFGANLLQRWKLPQAFSELLILQETQEVADVDRQEVLLVKLANILAIEMGYGDLEVVWPDPDLSMEIMARLRIPEAELQEITGSVKTLMETGMIV